MNYFINYESFNEYNENMANALVTESAMNFYNILGGDQLDIGLESFSSSYIDDPVLEGLKDNIVSAGSSIKNAITKGWAIVKEKWNAFVSWLKNLVKKKPKVDGEKANIFVRAWNKIVGIFKAGVDKIASLFSNKSDIADESFINLDFALEGAGETSVPEKIKIAQDIAQEIEKTIQELAKSNANSIDEISELSGYTIETDELVNNIISSGDRVLNQISSVIKTVKTAIVVTVIITLIITAIAGGITIYKRLTV